MPVKNTEPWTDISLYEPMDLDDDMEWGGIQLLDIPQSEFLTNVAENDAIIHHQHEQQLQQQHQIQLQQNLVEQQSSKYTIRNHDCMWSGRCVAHPEKIKCTNNNMNNHNNNKINHNHTTQNNHQPQQQQSQQMISSTNTKSQIQQIPAGRSLLLNSRIPNNNNNKIINKLPVITTSDFLKDRENIVRPDTPTSLDDDPPEFKHTIDLAACTMGSNRMSLIDNEDESPAKIINLLKEHLEDPSANDFRPFLSQKSGSLSDLLIDMKNLSDYEELDDDDDEDDDEDSNVEMDSDSESASSSLSSAETTQMSSNNSSSQSHYNSQATHVADHSYTRSKNRVDIHALGVQTPSDSGKFFFSFNLFFFWSFNQKTTVLFYLADFVSEFFFLFYIVFYFHSTKIQNTRAFSHFFFISFTTRRKR